MLASSAPGLFVLVGVSLLAGFAGHLLFQRHRVSDVLVLIGVGAVLGPLLHVLDPALLAGALPFLAPFGLALVLFEGGLELSYADLREHARRGLAMTLATWLGTAAAVAVVAHLLAGLAWTPAALLGAAVAATGIFVVIPLLARMQAPASAKVALTIETAAGDLLSAVVVTAVSSMIVLGATAAQGALLLGMKVAVGAAMGLLAGVAWARALHALREGDHPFPLTLAALLATFALAETLGGSGLVAALTFGLFLGNAPALVRLGGLRSLAAPPAGVRLHQRETVFILRSVFFVYLGLSMSPAVLTWSGALLGIALVGTMVAVRVATVFLTARGRTPEERAQRVLLVGMMPRGLATVLIAGIPVAMGVPGTARFLEYALLVLVGCDLATSAMLRLYEKRYARKATTPAAVAAAPAV